MNIFNRNRVMDRLDKMIDNAYNGDPIEKGFDESKMSQLETRLAKFLTMNNTTKKQLEDEKMKINSLISDISHQTKTPISNIVLYSQLLVESDLSKENQIYVNSLVEQTEKLNFLISSLIKASRLETGIITLNPKSQNVSCLVKNALEQVKPTAKAKNISIYAKLNNTPAYFDYKWTLEALLNIIDNAIKYTDINGEIEISIVSYDLFCRINIIDNGIGISDDDMTKIFSRFYRSNSVSHIKGVGLGLYLSRQIISNGGGYIKVNSKLNMGSTFSIFLPITP